MLERILTTHVGSLPRPERVVTQLFAQDSGVNYIAADFDRVMAAEVADVVALQAQSNVDVVSDGEMGKISYAIYIRHRLTGFELGEMPRTFAGFGAIHPPICFAKLASMSEGAGIASRELWK